MLRPIDNEILQKIAQNGKGKLVFPSQFKEMNRDPDVRKALSTLTREKLLIRLGRGVYLYPKYDPELGALYPSPEEIAEAIASADKVRIIPAGAQALYKLRLSQQVPMKLVFLTDGARRTIKLGKTTIIFTITTPKILASKGKLSSLAIQALQALGKSQVTEADLAKIRQALAKEDPELLKHDAALAPAWIAKILYSAKNESI